MQHLALADQILDRAGHVFDGDCGIDTVLVQQIDAVRPQAFQHAVDGRAYVIGPAVEAARHPPRFRVDIPAELGGNHHLIAERRQRFAQDPFDFERTISFRGIEEGHATVMSGAGDGDQVGSVRGRCINGARHVLAAESDARNLELSEFAPPVNEQLDGSPTVVLSNGRAGDRRGGDGSSCSQK